MTTIGNNRIRAVLACCMACVLVATSAQAGHELDHRDIAAGRDLYGENCAQCHGENLQGQANWQVAGEDGVLPAPPHDATGHTWHHANGLLFDYTKYGGQKALEKRGVSGFKSGMPEFSQSLSDQDIWNILAYIKSTWPDRIQANHQARNPVHD